MTSSISLCKKPLVALFKDVLNTTRHDICFFFLILDNCLMYIQKQ